MTQTKIIVDCSGTLPPEEREQVVPITEGEWAQIQADAVSFAPVQAGIYRQQRNALLISSDWTQMSDAPLTDAKRKAWAKYRQELRDLTFDEEPNWPKQPR